MDPVSMTQSQWTRPQWKERPAAIFPRGVHAGPVNPPRRPGAPPVQHPGRRSGGLAANGRPETVAEIRGRKHALFGRYSDRAPDLLFPEAGEEPIRRQKRL